MSLGRRRYVLGNWKMYGSLAANASLLEEAMAQLADPAFNALRGADAPVAVGVAAPFPYLSQVQQALQASVIGWGAQDLSPEASGAYTGEVSAAMLNDFGCSYVLVGHSERRARHDESNELVARKAVAAQAAGLLPVVCFGETLEQREAGNTLQIIEEQLAPVLALGAQALRGLVLAYEPVWAIGTGKTATPEQAQEVHAAVREALAQAGAAEVSVLYGGSVKAANAASLFAMADIDGGLIGGAALDAADFAGIVRAACAAVAA
ncbi:MAG: triose-phosphate isomerase [Pigmentiphaga sp.]